MSAELERARVLLTRPAADVAELADGIRALGGEPTCIPMIRIAGTTEPDALAAARDRIDAFDWIALTSRHAARALLDGIGAPGAGAPRICAVGASTAAAAREAGWEPAVVAPGRGGADALADELLATGDLTGQRILYPCSNLARPVLAERLIAVGAAVEQVEAYRTVPPAEVPGSPVAYDLAVFGSPSAAINYAQLPGAAQALAETIVAVALGPTTGRALEELGAAMVITAERPDAEGLLAAVVRAWQNKRSQ